MSSRFHHPEPDTSEYDKRGVTANQKATLRAFDRFYSWFPSFLDIFPDEDAFLNFAVVFVCCTLVTAILMSRFVKITPSGHF